MRHRYLASLGALAGALLWLASIPVDGQVPAAKATAPARALRRRGVIRIFRASGT